MQICVKRNTLSKGVMSNRKARQGFSNCSVEAEIIYQKTINRLGYLTQMFCTYEMTVNNIL